MSSEGPILTDEESEIPCSILIYGLPDWVSRCQLTEHFNYNIGPVAKCFIPKVSNDPVSEQGTSSYHVFQQVQRRALFPWKDFLFEIQKKTLRFSAL